MGVAGRPLPLLDQNFPFLQLERQLSRIPVESEVVYLVLEVQSVIRTRHDKLFVHSAPDLETLTASRAFLQDRPGLFGSWVNKTPKDLIEIFSSPLELD